MAINDAALRDDLMRRIVRLEDEIKRLRLSRRLEAATVGEGGIRLLGGTITVDDGGDIHIKDGTLIAGDETKAHAEITPRGYRLTNGDGETVIDLTTSGLNQILLRGSGNEDNEILLSANGEINGRILNAEEINLDGQSLGKILESIWNKIREDAESKPDPDPPPATGTITRTYNASWSQTYRSSGSKNDFAKSLVQGYYSGTNGNQKSLIGFPSSTIQSDHGLRTITRVRVFLYYDHWYYNGGGTAVLGHHGHSSKPGSFAAAATDVVRSGNWPKPGGRWVTYSDALQEWGSGTKKGIVLGPGPSSSRTYYGNARAHNQSKPPKLEIRSTA